MRALAVVAVMIYHANSDWLKGGFLGVEVFFVISGYLITLLLIAEKERTDTVDMKNFWLRRARRLLPALFVMLFALTIWTALFERSTLGKLRGDIIAALTYSSNWYQIFTGAGYSAGNDFAPLRHLWSLAVEEQFYLFWPVVMILLLRVGSRRVADLSRWLVITAVAITVVVALLYHPGPIGTAEVTPGAYWNIFGRSIAKADFLYLSTVTRLSGLLLGSAFAMVWRPVALMRGPMRDRAPLLDGFAAAGVAVLGLMMWTVGFVSSSGADPMLFRGGFLVASIATVVVIAAVTHPLTLTAKAMSAPPLVWLGVRSYGLYLYHWPIYQLIRNIAGKPLRLHEFAIAMVVTLVITELSYRFVETPIRKGALGRSWRQMRTARDPGRRNAVLAGAFCGTVLTIFAGTSLATAELQQNDVARSLEAGAEGVCDVLVDPTCGQPDPATETPPGATVESLPQPTVAGQDPTTTIATTTTVPVPVVIPKLAIGDSVMLGATQSLTSAGFTVDAAENRFFADGADIAAALQAEGRLGDVVVVHLGTNGPIVASDLDRMMTALADVPLVLLLTNDLPAEARYDYLDANNGLIYGAVDTYPNVELLDWQGLNDLCVGDCVYSDAIHLKSTGQAFYATLIQDRLVELGQS